MDTVGNMSHYTRLFLYTTDTYDIKSEVPLNAYEQVFHDGAASTQIIMLVG